MGCEFCQNQGAYKQGVNGGIYAYVESKGGQTGVLRVGDEVVPYMLENGGSGTLNEVPDGMWDLLDIDYCPFCGRKLRNAEDWKLV